MAILTINQAIGFAQQAGFSGKPLQIIVAIAQAESGLNTAATHPSTPGLDRGILQINSFWHHEVSDNCAYDAACAFRAGWQISNHGTSFSPWSTFQNGAYLKFAGSLPVDASQQQQLGGYTGKPWYSYPVSLGFNTLEAGGVVAEHGIDLATPLDTPMTAVFAGTITDISAPGWGKQVTWRLDNPQAAHGAPYEYVIHLDNVNPRLSVGQHIDAGTLLGWTGGANSQSQLLGSPYSLPPGMTHTLDLPVWSTGPHTEIGLYAGPVFASGPAWSNRPQQSLDPTFMLSLAQQEHLPYGTAFDTGTSGFTTGGPSSLAIGFTPFTQSDTQNQFGYDQLAFTVHHTLVQNPGFYGICLALDEAEHFPGIVSYYGIQDLLPWNIAEDTWKSVIGTIVGNTMPFVIRGSLILFGFLMLIALMWQFMKPALQSAPDLLGVA